MLSKLQNQQQWSYLTLSFSNGLNDTAISFILVQKFREFMCSELYVL